MISARRSCLFIATLGLAGFADTLAEACKQVMREHELIYLFFGPVGVIAIVDTIVLKSLGLVHGWHTARVAHGHG